MRRLPGHLRRRVRAGEQDRGSLSLMLALLMVAIFAVLALVVDGGGRLQALAKAQATAQEAARTGAQSLDYGQAISGEGFTVDGGAVTAAQAYLHQAGVTGTVTPNGNRLLVDVSVTYTPVFPFFGSWQVTGHGSAVLLYQAGG